MLIGNLDPIFGKNLQHLRQRTHMSRKTLAVLAGMSEDDICKIEAADGFLELDSRVLERLCAIFCVTANDLARVELESVASPASGN